MKRFAFIVWSCIFCWTVTAQAQQKEAVLIKIGNKTITKQEVLGTLVGDNRTNTELSEKEFNNVLDFYLSIHDFKEKGRDKAPKFKRHLETQLLEILGGIYRAEHKTKLINETMRLQERFAIVKDLYVPFDPILLKELDAIKSRDNDFSSLVKYASSYEDVRNSTRIITPTEASRSLCLSAQEVLKEQDKTIYGPIRDGRGYHYLQFEREQVNFGQFKMQVLYISDFEGRGAQNIKEAYKALKNSSFEETILRYSENLQDDDDRGIRYFIPSINSNTDIQNKLENELKDGDISAPFLSGRAWYIIKRISHEQYPSESLRKKQVGILFNHPSLFLEQLEAKYEAKEFPQHFLSGQNEILFLIAKKPYFEEDLKNYCKELAYNYTTESYWLYYKHLLLEEYKKEVEQERLQRLIDTFYFMEIRNPVYSYGRQNKKERIARLKRLVKEYNPIIPNKKYEENNPVFND